MVKPNGDRMLRNSHGYIWKQLRESVQCGTYDTHMPTLVTHKQPQRKVYICSLKVDNGCHLWYSRAPSPYIYAVEINCKYIEIVVDIMRPSYILNPSSKQTDKQGGTI